jgi:Xaa-Pro aminopeptidase
MPELPISLLRSELSRLGLDGFIVPRADEHLGEYVPAAAERLAWLTGFSGSAGLAIVLADRAALFVDGRYTLQAAAQTDPVLWERHHLIEEPPAAWLAGQAGKAARIGYDPLLLSETELARFTAAGLGMLALPANPIDAVWADRPAAPLAPAVIHPLEFAGRASAEKRAELAASLRAAGQDAAMLTDPASIAWLFNLRGSDVPFTPFALGFALLFSSGRATLFMAPEKLPAETRAWLGNEVAVEARAALPGALAALAGQRVRVDPATAPVWFAQTLRAAGATVVAAADPCALPKACKNPVEQQGMRQAHARDAVALARFYAWLPGAMRQGITEADAVARLHELRAEDREFRGESFATIAGTGPNAAINHYHVTPESNRPVRPGETFLIDAGAQYACGTTDVTRTVWTGPGPAPQSLRAEATRVLQGHIALATLAFPPGTTGAQIDAVARAPLWNAGLDFDHGTGHGVGSYLSVHEGPARISRAAAPVALAPGMVLSDEPGYYVADSHGIRLENLLLVVPAELPGATRPFLAFETLTLTPFDRALIDPALLTAGETAWLDAYHRRVAAALAGRVDVPTAAWLEQACAPLARASAGTSFS